MVAKNPKKAAAAKRSRLKHLEKRMAEDRARYQLNKERAKQTAIRWRENNREFWDAYSKDYMKKWIAENKEQYNLLHRRAKARRRGAEGYHTQDDIQTLRSTQQDRCAACRVDMGGRHTVDHIHPVSRGGSNWPNNIQLLCRRCNQRKGARTMTEWRAATGQATRPLHLSQDQLDPPRPLPGRFLATKGSKDSLKRGTE